MLTRARMASVWDLAEELGPYDFWPVIPAGIDPQLHASVNDRSQPFHLVPSHDEVLIHFIGSGRVEFADGSVRWFSLTPGDYVYLPAGIPYRVDVDGPSLQAIFRAEKAGVEALAWYCTNCGELVSRSEFDSDTELLQRGLHRLSAAFNEDTARRTCKGCGFVLPTIELDAFHWLEVAEKIEQLDAEGSQAGEAVAGADAGAVQSAAPRVDEGTAKADGNWDVVIDSPMGDFDLKLALSTDENNAVTGSATATAMGVTIPIDNGKIDGSDIGFSVTITSPMAMTLEFVLTISGDSLSGTSNGGMFPAAKVTGKRSRG